MSEQVRGGDGLVIEAGFALGGGEVPKRRAEAHERFGKRVALQVVPGHADMFAVVKPAGRFSPGFEGQDEGIVIGGGHSDS